MNYFPKYNMFVVQRFQMNAILKNGTGKLTDE